MKKIEGLFGLKLENFFDEKKYNIVNKQFIHKYYHLEINDPPNPNVLFKDYSIRCSKDMIIQDISAKTLSPIPIDDAMQRQEDLGNYFIETYFDNYSIFFWDFEHFINIYEFVPFDKKIIPLRKDYRNFIHPNETTKELTITIFGQSDNYKQVELLLGIKDKENDYEPIKIYENEDVKKYDTGKGYTIDTTGL